MHSATGPSKAPRRIEGMFDAIATRYDVLNHLLSAGIDRRWRRVAVQSLELTGRDRVLDLCTGTADLAIAARAAQPGARRVVAVDFAAEMLRVGRAKLRRRQDAAAVSLVRGDATRIPLADRTMDAVTVGFGIRNVEGPEAACADIYRVLKAGGRLAILEFAIPTIPVVRAGYLFYFNHVLPRIGALVSRHRAAYGYLPQSVAAFATRDEFSAVLRRAGFARVAAHPLTFGIVILYTAVKPH